MMNSMFIWRNPRHTQTQFVLCLSWRLIWPILVCSSIWSSFGEIFTQWIPSIGFIKQRRVVIDVFFRGMASLWKLLARFLVWLGEDNSSEDLSSSMSWLCSLPDEATLSWACWLAEDESGHPLRATWLPGGLKSRARWWCGWVMTHKYP